MISSNAEYILVSIINLLDLGPGPEDLRPEFEIP